MAMDNLMLIGLTRQMTLRREMDITANNIANANTSGFKTERLLLETRTATPARHADGPSSIRFVGDQGMLRDFTQGTLLRTGRPLDLALDGPGFFTLETPAGERFTRDGRFTLNQAGELTAPDGARVLDENGQPVLIDPQAGPVEISPEGRIIQNGEPGARLGLAVFQAPGLLVKTGDNRFTAPDDAERNFEDAPRVRQGHTENSNVHPIREMTRMMQISQTYGSISSMIEDAGDLSRRAIERLGRP